MAGNLIIEQASLGLALGLACGVLLLILGTQILDWYWPLLLFALAFSIGLVRYWSKLPDDYRVAQLLDERLALPDTLSTAWHFTQAPAGAAEPGMRELQRDRAAQAAQQADAALAIPYRASRMTMVALGTLGVFSALMLYRYGSQSRLDLSQPLVPGLVDLFGSSTPSTLAQMGKKKFDTPQAENFDGTTASQDERKQDDAQALNEAPEDVLKTIGVPETDNSGAEPAKGEPLGKEEGTDGKDEGGGEQGEKSSGGEAGKSSDKSGEQGSKESNKDAKNGQQQQQGGENNSLMDKFRDAMANLMNKIKQPGKQGGEQMAKNQQKQDGQGQGKGEGSKQGEKGSPQQGKPNAEGGDGEQKGDSEQEGGEQQQAAKGKGSSDSNQPKGSDDPKSGMGSQDGAKDTRLAEQMQAMGKLSEIIGKRSEKQTGEVMVEVSSGKNQQLKTAYTQRTGQHADTGGEIHRDEVPLVYQQYVQSYFEQIRRTAPAPKPAVKPTP